MTGMTEGAIPTATLGVVERLKAGRVDLWGTKDDRDKGDPEHDGDRVWVQTCRGGRLLELICVDDLQGDGQS